MLICIILKNLICFDKGQYVYVILPLEKVYRGSALSEIVALNDNEKEWLSSEIKKFRGEYIKSPDEYLQLLKSKKKVDITSIKDNVSNGIETLREGCWNLYLEDEAVFNKKFIAHLIKSRKFPNTKLKECIESFDIKNSKNFDDDLSDLIGDYTGSIMPYLYALDLSTTNSRRSRSGKTFEAIIKFLIKDVYEYPFDDQSTVAEGFFREQGIGKIVDGIIPGKDSYISNRAKSLIITMKTSLRERWQEVAEEIKRTNIPQIYLLTVDDSISASKLKTMGHQNICVVNYDTVKEQYKDFNNVISFTEFFNEEIPHCLKYWEKRK
jgi:type-2 restriction enzyme ssoII